MQVDEVEQGAVQGTVQGAWPELPDSLECVVCMEQPRSVMMEPCGHVCCCADCADRLRTPRQRQPSGGQWCNAVFLFNLAPD